MKRRGLAIFFLLLFLHGSLGFSLTRHYCTHSGKELYAIGNRVNHLCTEKAEIAACCKKPDTTRKPSCCEVEKRTPKAYSLTYSDRLRDDCCTDQESYFRISDSLIKNIAEWQIIVPFNDVLFTSNYNAFASVLKLSEAYSFSAIQIPPLLASDSQSILCVFRI